MDIQGFAEAQYRLGHAMQSGVAMKMNYDPQETQPKHLRVGVNMAMSQIGAIQKILIDKGIISESDMFDVMTQFLQMEVDSYKENLKQHFGRVIDLA